ncbi:MAG: XRE family transcriptional regulator [Deltaproteobacteria bacterium]|nr:XRE family transcriptional regulator [Deltaproteobacteria bacterium]
MNRKLKAKIVEHFGSQADFAQVVKKDDSFISRVVRERRVLPVEIQKKWADVLLCNCEDIFQRGEISV